MAPGYYPYVHGQALYAAGREDELDLFRLRICRDFFRGLDLVVLDQRLSGAFAARPQERVRHRAADHQPVHHIHQVLDHFDLIGHLRAAEDRHAWTRRIPGRLGEVFDFLVHQESGRGLVDVHDHPHG